LPEQPRHLDIADAGANALHQLVMIDVVETALDVAFDDPRVGGPPTSAVFARGRMVMRICSKAP
jgi:hypothetical protein